MGCTGASAAVENDGYKMEAWVIGLLALALYKLG